MDIETNCCFCGNSVGKYGNNPEPLMDSENNTCCDSCNLTKVIPYRLASITRLTQAPKKLKSAAVNQESQEKE